MNAAKIPQHTVELLSSSKSVVISAKKGKLTYRLQLMYLNFMLNKSNFSKWPRDIYFFINYYLPIFTSRVVNTFIICFDMKKFLHLIPENTHNRFHINLLQTFGKRTKETRSCLQKSASKTKAKATTKK